MLTENEATLCLKEVCKTLGLCRSGILRLLTYQWLRNCEIASIYCKLYGNSMKSEYIVLGSVKTFTGLYDWLEWYSQRRETRNTCNILSYVSSWLQCSSSSQERASTASFVDVWSSSWIWMGFLIRQSRNLKDVWITLSHVANWEDQMLCESLSLFSLRRQELSTLKYPKVHLLILRSLSPTPAKPFIPPSFHALLPEMHFTKSLA